jgi:hypothetical protein
MTNETGRQWSCANSGAFSASEGKQAPALLVGTVEPSYNTEKFLAPAAKERTMANFEQIGRKMDKELEKLRRYLEKDLKPAAKRKAAQTLRKASKQLADAAKELEARVAKIKF